MRAVFFFSPTIIGFMERGFDGSMSLGADVIVDSAQRPKVKARPKMSFTHQKLMLNKAKSGSLTSSFSFIVRGI